MTCLTATPSCADGIKNQDETDIDCGGSCNQCAPTKSCLVNTDCTSLKCTNSKCSKSRIHVFHEKYIFADHLFTDRIHSSFPHMRWQRSKPRRDWRRLRWQQVQQMRQHEELFRQFWLYQLEVHEQRLRYVLFSIYSNASTWLDDLPIDFFDSGCRLLWWCKEPRRDWYWLRWQQLRQVCHQQGLHSEQRLHQRSLRQLPVRYALSYNTMILV